MTRAGGFLSALAAVNPPNPAPTMTILVRAMCSSIRFKLPITPASDLLEQCSGRLCGRRRLFCSREVRQALLKECRKCFFGVCRAHSGREFLVFKFRRLL